MATKHDFHKTIIGRSEMLEIIDAGNLKVPAKTDTGAYRSSIHASNIKVGDDGILRFDLLIGHPTHVKKIDQISTDTYSRVTVVNSFGQREKRYEIKLRVKLGPKVFTASFSLADRSGNKYPVLLGRQLLNDRFLIDTTKSNVNATLMKKQFGIDFRGDEEDGS